MNQIIDNFNIQGMFELCEEKFGKKLTYEYSGLLYMWYLVETNKIRPNKQSIIDYLIDNNVFDNFRDVTKNTNRYIELRSKLPRLSMEQKTRLDRSYQYLNPVVQFEQVGSRNLGIIDNHPDHYSVVDISEGRENVVGVIFKKGNGISWRDNNLDGIHMKWVLEHQKNGFVKSGGII